MDIDTPALPDIHLLVRKAREELAGVITALTHVLASVAVWVLSFLYLVLGWTE